jgi:hypothetical protein
MSWVCCWALVVDLAQGLVERVLGRLVLVLDLVEVADDLVLVDAARVAVGHVLVEEGHDLRVGGPEDVGAHDGLDQLLRGDRDGVALQFFLGVQAHDGGVDVGQLDFGGVVLVGRGLAGRLLGRQGLGEVGDFPSALGDGTALGRRRDEQAAQHQSGDY